MSKIRGQDTKIEILVRSALFRRGFRFRKNVRSLPGIPDIVLPKYNSLVFVNGCFWHGHKNCSAFRLPKTRTKYWSDKISANSKRDQKNLRRLRAQGWRCFTVWECRLKKNFSHEIDKLEKKIKAQA
ncbi:MAG: DNA mismatch endonuclease Vsr [Bacteriovoracaceae bacterium]|nr:DNA mismatch endonuclease Vsr [Bacteriovoracaceae bacterium]